MDLHAPVSSIMSTKLITVSPEDRLAHVNEIFENNRIHHLPVVRFTNLVGMISKTDLRYFLRGAQLSEYDKILETSRLNAYKAQDIMTSGLATLEPNDKINVALEIFKENLFHAIPIIKDGALVGILTTHDIIKALSDSDGR